MFQQSEARNGVQEADEQSRRPPPRGPMAPDPSSISFISFENKTTNN
jgi:hypothetical protein